ncbi:MAG: hypothetical protein ACWA6X_05825 [Bauldia sp.]
MTMTARGLEQQMVERSPQEIRSLLREVRLPGSSRDIVSAGFVKDIVGDGRGGATILFRPDTTNVEKVRQMEEGIGAALSRAGIVPVHVETTQPFGEAEMSLRRGGEQPAHDDDRRPITADADSDAVIDRAMTGPGLMNPLQAELLEDGVPPEPDILHHDVTRGADHGPGAGLGGEPPSPLEGPVGTGDTYDGDLPVLQWQIDPHDPAASNYETGVRHDDWEIRIWWQVHASGELFYASLQAMRDDWADHLGTARPHPVGRSAAVNLVYDRTRHSVVAIYGTVRDFRPFVEAFRKALFTWAKDDAARAAGEEKQA